MRMWEKLKKYFISGLAVIVPIVLTVYIILLILKLIDVFIGRYVNSFLLLWLGFTIPGLHILLSFLVILLLGIVAQIFLVKKLVGWLNIWIMRMPVIGRIYSSVKKVSEYFFSVDGVSRRNFGKVVLIEYPRKGIFTVAFVSNEGISLPVTYDKKFVSVFVPTSPSPLTGFLEFVREDEVVYLDISVEDALQMIMSGGVVVPEQWREDNNE